MWLFYHKTIGCNRFVASKNIGIELKLATIGYIFDFSIFGRNSHGRKWAWSHWFFQIIGWFSNYHQFLYIPDYLVETVAALNLFKDHPTFAKYVPYYTHNHDFAKTRKNSKSQKKLSLKFFEIFLKISSLCVLNDADHFKPKKLFSISAN